MTSTIEITELQADAKKVYNCGVNTLVELADKYDVTTRSLTYAKQNPNPVYASFGHQAFASKSDQKAIQSALYRTIKDLIAEA